MDPIIITNALLSFIAVQVFIIAVCAVKGAIE